MVWLVLVEMVMELEKVVVMNLHRSKPAKPTKTATTTATKTAQKKRKSEEPPPPPKVKVLLNHHKSIALAFCDWLTHTCKATAEMESPDVPDDCMLLVFCCHTNPL